MWKKAGFERGNYWAEVRIDNYVVKGIGFKDKKERDDFIREENKKLTIKE